MQQKPGADNPPEFEGGRDERPSILVGNQNVFLQIETDGSWQSQSGDGRKWAAADNRDRPARDLRVRVLQGASSDDCRQFRQGANVRIVFGAGQQIIVTLPAGTHDPIVTSTVSLHNGGGGRLESTAPGAITQVSVGGRDCNVSGQVRIEICLKGNAC